MSFSVGFSSFSGREYPPTVWAAGEVVQEQVLISAVNLKSGSYAVWVGMCWPLA